MFLTYATLSFYHMCLFVWHRHSVCSLYMFMCVCFRAAQSAQCRLLHTACVHSATSGCVTSAQMCISIREPPPLPSTQTCTSSIGPVPPRALTCTRETPAPCLRLDKARYFPYLNNVSPPFPTQYDRLSIGLYVNTKLVFASLFSLWGFVCLLVMSQ